MWTGLFVECILHTSGLGHNQVCYCYQTENTLLLPAEFSKLKKSSLNKKTNVFAWKLSYPVEETICSSV